MYTDYTTYPVVIDQKRMFVSWFELSLQPMAVSGAAVMDSWFILF